jgi:hypothetical protein
MKWSKIALCGGTVLAFLFALPFLTWAPMAIVYLVTRFVPQPEGALNSILLGFYGLFFLASWLLSVTARYLFFSAAALALSLITLGLFAAVARTESLRRPRFYLLAACAVSVLAFPVVARYRPAVEAARGIELRIVNQPGFLEGAVRTCQTLAEVQNETYVPRGWADEHTLLYQQYRCGPQGLKWDCGDETPWVYDVETGQAALSLADEPPLFQDTCDPQTCVKPRLATEWLFSGHQSPQAYISPDGRWIAFTARHVYGPEDLLIVSTETMAPPTATPAPPDPLTTAQEALAAYQPASDAQPVVSALSLSIAEWLGAGGDPAALALALTTASDLGEAAASVTKADLTGDGQEDVVVRIPVMGLPLLVFVRDGLGPPGFAGVALPPDFDSIRTDFPLETTEIDKPALQLEDLTGDGMPEVLFASMFAGASNYRLRPEAYRWQDGDFRLIFAADLVSWAGRSDYALEPDPTGKGSLQIVLTYPHLYNHGFDHKMINHPPGQQVWRWRPEAGRYVLFEKEVDLEHNSGGLPAAASDRLRWLTNEGEEAFRAGQYEEAIARYEEVLRRAEAEDWQPGGDEADWRAYAAFRRAEALLLLARPDEGLPALEAVVTDMEGDLLGDLARAFLQGYGSGEDPDAAARGVAAMQGGDLYAHLYYERPGALRFPMEASGILYPGAGMAAYLNAHPDLAGDLPALRAGLAEIGFQVGGVLADENGDLSIIVPLPNRSYAYGQDSWVLAVDGDRWHVSLPVSEGEWPVVGWFAP